jgi:hypothetical protein
LLIKCPPLKNLTKGFHENQKLLVRQVIQKIIENPKIGELKRGDLAGVYVYKFKIDHQQNTIGV